MEGESKFIYVIRHIEIKDNNKTTYSIGYDNSDEAMQDMQDYIKRKCFENNLTDDEIEGISEVATWDHCKSLNLGDSWEVFFDIVTMHSSDSQNESQST